jgi:hypothetical protein
MEHDDTLETPTMISNEYVDMLMLFFQLLTADEIGVMLGLWEATCPGSLDEAMKNVAESYPENTGIDRDMLVLVQWPGLCQAFFLQGLALLPA